MTRRRDAAVWSSAKLVRWCGNILEEIQKTEAEDQAIVYARAGLTFVRSDEGTGAPVLQVTDVKGLVIRVNLVTQKVAIQTAAAGVEPAVFEDVTTEIGPWWDALDAADPSPAIRQARKALRDERVAAIAAAEAERLAKIEAARAAYSDPVGGV